MEQQYKNVLFDVMKRGVLRPNRTETSALSLFDVKLKFDVSKFYPILTSKFIDIKIVNAEFEWLMSGQTNTALFKQRGIKIWDKWADDNGNLGPVYGYQLINFNSEGYNQINEVIKSLQNDPMGRRHILTLWNPLQLKEMRLPPCYLYFQFYVELPKRLNVFVVQRSGDMFAGIPYDVCVFTNLLNYVANVCDYTPGIISHTIVDAHIYTDHIDGVKQYFDMPILPQPKYQADLFGCIELIDYTHGPRIKIPIAK